MTDHNTHVQGKFYYWDKESPPVQVSLTLVVEDNDPATLVAGAKELSKEALGQGFYVDYPTSEEDVEPGQSLVEANSAIRRRFTRRDGQEADLLDFFVDGMEFRVSYVYINNERDRAYLEHATGLVFDSMPVVEGNQAVTRPQGQPHDGEVRLPHRMKIVRDPEIDKATGQRKHFGEHPQWLFSHFLGIPKESALDTPAKSVDESPADLTKIDYENWRERIVIPGQSVEQLVSLIREAMVERLPELIEQNHEKMMVMVPDDIEGLTMLDWLGYDTDWTIKTFKETLGYKSMYGGYRIVQAGQVVDLFEANFLFQCVELTEDDQRVAQSLMDQTVAEALEIEREHEGARK